MSDHRAQVRFNLIPVSGMRLEQVSALPAASAQNEGQVVQLTSDSHGYMNVAGTWKKFTNPLLADVQGLSAALGNKLDVGQKDQANGYAGLDASGLVTPTKLGTGTPSATTFLRGDKTWATLNPAAIGAEPALAQGTTSQYYRGDKTWQTLIGSTSTTAMAGSTTLNSIPVATAAVNLNSQRISSLADPTQDTDAANKRYVDNAINGIAPKESVRVATTANIGLTGAATIDGIVLAQNDRILVKDQSVPSQNGIYLINTSGAWTRATDMDSAGDMESAFTFVEEGAVNGNSGWLMTSDNITVGTTALNWVQFSGAGQIDAGAGLTKSGNQLNVGGTLNRIQVNADSIDISAAYIGQATITTVGTITNGAWNGAAIGIQYGGTGASTQRGARVALQTPSQYGPVALPVTAAGVWNTITHGLAHNGIPDVTVVEVSTLKVVEFDVEWTSVNSVKVKADVSMADNEYQVSIVIPSVN